MAPAVRESHRRAVIAFLRHCKHRHTPASVAVIRDYLDTQSPSSREALRWFYRAARDRAVSGPTESPADPAERHTPESEGGVSAVDRPNRQSVERVEFPPLASTDLGGADWERDLIAAMRLRGFLWRTEESYRRWAAQFAQFLSPRTPYCATAEDVGAFLTALAVARRAMPSTQKQALNALVFLMQEALHRDLGEIPFRRAQPRRRVPTVLTPSECQRLFAQLDALPRLMAELMYGSGLRLLELLRLRVHHLDLERGQVRVVGGKGDRVYGCADAAGALE